MTTCYLVYEGRIKCFLCEHYATNAALTRLLSPEKSLNMGHESTELSFYRYGGLQQIHHWTTWFSTAPRHSWIHLQPPERQSDLFHDYLRDEDFVAYDGRAEKGSLLHGGASTPLQSTLTGLLMEPSTSLRISSTNPSPSTL